MVEVKDHKCPCGIYDEYCPHCVHRDELIEDLRQAECGKCGRSLPPDGDCYGCESDRLRAELERLKDSEESLIGSLGEEVGLVAELRHELEKERYPRTEVRAFARLMEDNLRSKDWKGGWDRCEGDWLLARMLEEVAELALAIGGYDGDTDVETADVANFAMMICDVLGGLDTAMEEE